LKEIANPVSDGKSCSEENLPVCCAAKLKKVERYIQVIEQGGIEGEQEQPIEGGGC